MKIDEDLFRSILAETVDENPLACRAVLAVDRIELTNSVQTLSVSLGRQSTLRANLSFMEKHCRTEEHVKALLIHEFLHILLGHTIRFEKMTRSLNIALDAAINAIIHRKLGDAYSSMMANYYGGAKGFLQVLGPMEEEKRRAVNIAVACRQPVDPLTTLHAALYNGKVLADDILSIASDLCNTAFCAWDGEGPLLLGDHERDFTETAIPEGVEGMKIRQTLVSLDAEGIFRDIHARKPQSMRPLVVQEGISSSWRAVTLQILRRLVTPDIRGRVDEDKTRTHLAPILNCADRRGALRAMWSPVIPDNKWEVPLAASRGTVQVYLDVSASMGQVLQPLVRLLAEFSGVVRRPLWAFSTEVSIATIIKGELQTRTTGGTSLACVYEHLKKTRPAKALVITDGYVENGRSAEEVSCNIEAIIPHDGHEAILQQVHRIPVTRLSPLTR